MNLQETVMSNGKRITIGVADIKGTEKLLYYLSKPWYEIISFTHQSLNEFIVTIVHYMNDDNSYVKEVHILTSNKSEIVFIEKLMNSINYVLEHFTAHEIGEIAILGNRRVYKLNLQPLSQQ